MYMYSTVKTRIKEQVFWGSGWFCSYTLDALCKISLKMFLNTKWAYKRLSHAPLWAIFKHKHKMVDAHSWSVVETNKANIWVRSGWHMHIYQCSGHLFAVTHRKVNVIKQMFIFISYSAHFIGWHPGWEQRRANRCGGRLLHFDFYIQLLFLHTNAIDETALWISELSKLAHS